MPTIKVPHSFFVKERQQVYTDWRGAFWREFIQNSLDAGATKIDFTLGVLEQDPKTEKLNAIIGSQRLMVTVEDNGPGMSRDVLENVYMSLGASTKEQTGSIGGFGRARILTCFSHPRWILSSQEWVCTSTPDGAGYEVHDNKVGYTSGLRAQVEVESHRGMMLDALWRTINQCELGDRVIFTLNGDEMHKLRFYAPIAMGEALKPMLNGEGQLYAANGDACTHKIVVRVNGMVMFNTDLHGASDGKGYVLELLPKTSRNHLTASRDEPRGTLRTELYSLVSELNRGNRDAAMAQHEASKLTRYGNEVRCSVDTRLLLPDYMIERMGRKVPSDFDREISRSIKIFLGDRAREREEIMNKAEEDKDPITLYLEGSGCASYINANGKIWHDAAVEWNPTNWRAVLNGRYVGWLPKFRHRAELLKAWSLACDTAAASLALITGRQYFYLTGFVFDPTCRALCRENIGEYKGAAVNALLLNPLTETPEGKLREWYTIRTKDGLRELCAVAVHECIHMEHYYHDEEYATLMTKIMAILDLDELGTAIRGRI